MKAKGSEKASAEQPDLTEGGAEESIDLSGGPKFAEDFRERALAIPKEERAIYRGHPRLVADNVIRGTEAVLAERAQLQRDFRRLDLARLEDIPKLAVAHIWAADDVTRHSNREPQEIKDLVAEATKCRIALISNLQGAAYADLIPKSDVERLLDGERSRAGIARDCIAAARVFKAHFRDLKGKTGITKELVTRAAEVGDRLLFLLQPKGTRPTMEANREESIALRDGLLTILLSDYEVARRAGGWLFGDARDERVPAAYWSYFAHRPKDALAVARVEAEKAQKKAEREAEKLAEKEKNKALVDEARRLAEEARQKALEAKRAKKGKKGKQASRDSVT